MKPKKPTAKRPATRRRSQAERVALSDQRIVQATIRLLAGKGVEAATIQAIAAGAGYNHALLVHRYGSKTGLLMRVMDSVSAEWQALVAKHVGERQGIDALCAFLDAHIEFIETEPEEIMAMYRLWFNGAAPGGEYRARLAAIHREQRETVTAWLRRSLELGLLKLPDVPEVFGERFCAMLAGFIYQWLTDPQLPIVSIYQSIRCDLIRDHGASKAAREQIAGRARP